MGNSKGKNWLGVEFDPQALLKAMSAGREGDCSSRPEVQALMAQWKRQEALLDAFLDNSIVGICVVDAQGIVVRVNRHFARMFGYALDEVEGMHMTHFVAPYLRDDVLKAHQHFFQTQNGFSGLVEWEVLCRDGRTLYVEVGGSSYRDGDGTDYALLNIRDITHRKAAELKIRRQHDNLARTWSELEAILEHSLDLICIIDANGRFRRISASCQQILGYAPEDMLGRSYLSFVEHADRARSLEVARTLLSKKRVQYFENRYKHKNGRLVPLMWSIFWDDSTRLTYSIAHDTTHQKAAAEVLRLANERYELAGRATSDAIWDWDMSSNMVYWGKAYGAVFGYDADSVYNILDCDDNYHPEDRKRVVQGLHQAIREGRSEWEEEYRYRKADGTYAYVRDRGYIVRDATGRALRMVGAMSDITKQKEEEQRLRLFESAIANTSDGVLLGSISPNGSLSIIYANAALERIMGYEQAELLGKGPAMLYGGARGARYLAMVDEAMEKGELTEIEVQRQRKDGQLIWLLLVLVPIFDAKGRRTHWVSISKDITERKRQEAEREGMIRELRSRLDDLRQFTYITSHNLRAPLTNLMGLLALLDESKIEDAETRAILEGLRQSTQQLDSTVSDVARVLAVKGRKDVDQSLIALAEQWAKVCADAADAIQAEQAILSSDFSAQPQVYFNEAYLQNILAELLSNALKYRRRNVLPHIRVRSYATATEAVLEFQDNGLGMDLDRYGDRLFGLHQRFHNLPDSKGFGLYLVHAQVTALGGHIEVVSDMGKGTVFKIFFKKQ